MENGLNDVAAAKFLGLKPSTLRKYRFDGKGPAYYKMGGRVVYYTEDLLKFRSVHRIEPRRV